MKLNNTAKMQYFSDMAARRTFFSHLPAVRRGAEDICGRVCGSVIVFAYLCGVERIATTNT